MSTRETTSVWPSFSGVCHRVSQDKTNLNPDSGLHLDSHTCIYVDVCIYWVIYRGIYHTYVPMQLWGKLTKKSNSPIWSIICKVLKKWYMAMYVVKGLGSNWVAYGKINFPRNMYRWILRDVLLFNWSIY
jgi:hypothetical protein